MLCPSGIMHVSNPTSIHALHCMFIAISDAIFIHKVDFVVMGTLKVIFTHISHVIVTHI